MKQKIIIFTGYPAPYKVEFYNALDQHFDVTVIICESISEYGHRNKEWFNHNYAFKTILFDDIIKKITKKYIMNFDHIIINGYSVKNIRTILKKIKKYKLKYVMSIDGGIIKNENIIKKTIKSYFISGASAYLSPSIESDKYLIYYGAVKENIRRYLFTSLTNDAVSQVNPLRETRTSIRDDFNFNDEIIILYVGQFIHRKGIDIALKSFNLVKNCNTRLVLIGDSLSSELLEIIDNTAKNRITNIDFVKQDELFKYYYASDIFIFPTRQDIWGLVVNEAMSFGLPIVSSDKANASLELITNEENGYIVNIDNINEIASAIDLLADNKELRDTISSNNIEKLKSYTIENSVLMVKDILESYWLEIFRR